MFLSRFYTSAASSAYSKETDFQIALREYDALRRQVQTLMIIEVSTVNFTIVVGGIVVAALYQPTISSVFDKYPNLSLAIALLFPIFGLMNLYERVRLYCTVAYIDVYLRKKFNTLAGKDVLLWEDYLSSFKGPLMIFLDRVRSLIFVVPTFLLFFLFLNKTHGVYLFIDIVMMLANIVITLLYLFISARSRLSVYKQIAERRVNQDLTI